MNLKGLAGRILNPRSALDRLHRPHVEADNLPAGSAPAGARGRLRPRDVIFNLPLVIGALIVLGLFLLVLFGPRWAPKNPYIAGQHIVPHYDFARDEFISPPLPPSAEFPLGTDRWGNDLLSLLMHAARNTLVACSFITMVRVALGLALGGIAGWNEGGSSDQIIMGVIGIITSVPTLISSMILIFALDIRRGLPVFIVALSLIGWAEIAQYIRSEFLVLRKMPYIEGAHATGLTGLGIAVRHVVPNVLPQLLVISFLEMGAVMMLLGELGFVGVYIGGGTRFAVEIDPFTVEIFTVIEVPEWGAMLAEGFRWLRSKPFVVFPPALAFFLSVVGFNALGEGLRRLIETTGVNTAYLLKKRMLFIVAALALATVYIMNSTGAAPWFAKVAGAFGGAEAYQHVEILTEMDGRGIDQEGAAAAAAYIAEKLEEYGLKPGGRHSSYVHPLKIQLIQPLAHPYLALVDADGKAVQEFRHQIDFGFVTEGHGGSGEVEAPLTLVIFRQEEGDGRRESYQGLDLRGRVAVLLQGNAPAGFPIEAQIRGAEGILWISGNQRDDVRSQIQWADLEQDYVRQPTLPIFRIRPSVAEALLEKDGIPLSEQDGRTMLSLPKDPALGQSGPGWFTRDLITTVRMSLVLSEPQAREIPCVLGFKEGSDFDLSSELVVLIANYDGLGTDRDGTVFPGANHNASGVGTLLELARLWQEQDLDPRRSVLFVAWGGGQLDNPGIREFLENGSNFRHLPDLRSPNPLTPMLAFHLDFVGAGGNDLFIDASSESHLTELLTEAAAELGVPVTSERGASQPYTPVAPGTLPWVYLAWSDAEVPPDRDKMERIEVDKLQQVGEALAFTLTKVVRETDY
jgi:ABC-type dipeptide/oligopeptide/nickel transport system permease subunit